MADYTGPCKRQRVFDLDDDVSSVDLPIAGQSKRMVPICKHLAPKWKLRGSLKGERGNRARISSHM